jgi:hypothetical protein
MLMFSLNAEDNLELDKTIRIKTNAFALLIGIPNIKVEYNFSENISIEPTIFGIIYKGNEDIILGVNTYFYFNNYEANDFFISSGIQNSTHNDYIMINYNLGYQYTVVKDEYISFELGMLHKLKNNNNDGFNLPVFNMTFSF